MGTAGRNVPLPWLKPAILTGSLVPIAAIVMRAWGNALGPNPIAQALNQLGLIALVFLIAALACTPIKAIAGWTWPMRLRRMLGLLALAYALLHVITYTVLDQGLDWHAIYDDIVKRKFIFFGFSAFVLLIPLGATSTNSAVRRLGYVRWKQLHRLAYPAPALAVLHFVWRVKRDIREPVTYGLVLGTLLSIRIIEYLHDRKAREAKMRPQSKLAGGIVTPAIVVLIAALFGGGARASATEVAMSDSKSANAKILTDVLNKMRTGGKVEPSEFQNFVKAQNGGATTGLNVGQKIPDFRLADQNGEQRTFPDLTGPKGLLLVFTRSADW
jgi:methionine sulfoxide reductase heme-binding subunit